MDSNDIFLFRIPIPRTIYFDKSCFKKRLFIYIFPVIFISIILNSFKFLESDFEWNNGNVSLLITKLRVIRVRKSLYYVPLQVNHLYLHVNSWVR